jgi:uncharacterized surface protein with fasciclin (FAS1) repeats
MHDEYYGGLALQTFQMPAGNSIIQVIDQVLLPFKDTLSIALEA